MKGIRFIIGILAVTCVLAVLCAVQYHSGYRHQPGEKTTFQEVVNSMGRLPDMSPEMWNDKGVTEYHGARNGQRSGTWYCHKSVQLVVETDSAGFVQSAREGMIYGYNPYYVPLRTEFTRALSVLGPAAFKEMRATENVVIRVYLNNDWGGIQVGEGIDTALATYGQPEVVVSDSTGIMHARWHQGFYLQEMAYSPATRKVTGTSWRFPPNYRDILEIPR